MNRATVTVGIPFVDNRETLPSAIASVLAQRDIAWELILIDDGSSDGSYEVAAGVRDARVRLLRDGARRGLGGRLNQIARLSATPFIARMDADDVMHPGRLARQVAALEADADADLLGCQMYVMDSAGRLTGMRRSRQLSYGRAGVLRHGFLAHPTVLARREWLLANPYSEVWRRAEDHELWCRVAEHVKAIQMPEALHFYREPVPVNLAAYRATFQARARITRRYGPGALGWPGTLWMLLGIHAQGPVLRAARLLRLESALIARRNRPLTDLELGAAEAALEQVRVTVETHWGNADIPV